MNLDFKCIKCGSEQYDVKNVYLPEKNKGISFDIELYYIKTCLRCGFSEMYSAKVLEKNEKPVPEF